MPTSRILLANLRGIITSPGTLTRDSSSCIQADNVTFDAPGIVRKRRGFAISANKITDKAIWKLSTSRVLGTSLLCFVSDLTNYHINAIWKGDGTAAFTGIPMVDAVVMDCDARNGRPQVALSARNHYVSGSVYGCHRIESDLTTARYAGMPRGLGLEFNNTVLSGTPGFLPATDGRAAYRVTWHRKDADGIELGGAPTGRFQIYNTGGTSQYVTARILLPMEYGTTATPLTTSYYWRLWRTRAFTSVDPDDEYFLVAEAFLTAGNIAAGYVDFVDKTPDAYLITSPRLHTNATNVPAGEANTRQGIVNEDAPPPASQDLAYWQDCMWYGNTIAKENLLALTLLATGAPSGVQNNDTFVVGGRTYTFKTARAALPTLEVQIDTTATTTGKQVENTMQDLCRAINQDASQLTVWAYYVSMGSQLPGTIWLISRRHSLSSTAQCAARGTAFRPDITASTASSASTAGNELCFSKVLRADAVPPINTLKVGPTDNQIYRIVPYRGRLLVFTAYGIYQVTGSTYADFSVGAFDLTYHLIGPELVATCDDRVYAWCREGIIEVSDGGVKPISTPIEPTVQDVIANQGGGATNAWAGLLGEVGFAVAYQRSHQVQFWYPMGASEAGSFGVANWLTYDTRMQAWCTGSLQDAVGNGDWPNRKMATNALKAAAVARWSDDTLWLGNYATTGQHGWLFSERRTYAATDHRDQDNTATLVDITSTLLTQTQTPDPSGFSLFQECWFHWAQSEYASELGPPKGITATFLSEFGGSYPITFGTSGPGVTTAQETRIIIPPDARRANNCKVLLTHTAREFLGIEGIGFRMTVSGAQGRRT